MSACSASPVTEVKETPTSEPLAFATATLVSTNTPHPSATLAPPTVAPTVAPVISLVTTQVNVRSAPDKGATSLGLLNYGNRVGVIGKDESGKWFQIIYPENTNTTGWVTAAYVEISINDVDHLPVVQTSEIAPAAPALDSSGTPAPQPTAQDPASTPRTARVTRQIFVRVGPGQTYEPLGTVDAGVIVTLIGRNQNNVWIQIQHESAADGKGWVAAAYLEGANLQGLPYYDNEGKLISSGAPAASPGQAVGSATPISPAFVDGDSLQKPAAKLVFTPGGAREYAYSSDLSSPNGDTSDWVAFTAYEPTNQSTFLFFKLVCTGNGGITAILTKDGIPVPESRPLVCGNYDFAMKVLGGQEYILVLNADGTGGPLRYTWYDLTVKTER